MRSARLALVGCAIFLACAHASPLDAPSQPTPVVEPPFVPPPDAITLKASESWESENGSFLVEVVDVIDHSSPCPASVRCVWSGIVRQVILNVTLDGETEAWRLNERAIRSIGPWRVEVLNVTAPKASLMLRRDTEWPVDFGRQ